MTFLALFKGKAFIIVLGVLFQIIVPSIVKLISDSLRLDELSSRLAVPCLNCLSEFGIS